MKFWYTGQEESKGGSDVLWWQGHFPSLSAKLWRHIGKDVAVEYKIQTRNKSNQNRTDAVFREDEDIRINAHRLCIYDIPRRCLRA